MYIHTNKLFFYYLTKVPYKKGRNTFPNLVFRPVYTAFLSQRFCLIVKRAFCSALLSLFRKNAFSIFVKYMLEHGIHLGPSQFEAMFLSNAHTEETTKETLEIFEGFLKQE